MYPLDYLVGFDGFEPPTLYLKDIKSLLAKKVMPI